jgi:hypothetical protein
MDRKTQEAYARRGMRVENGSYGIDMTSNPYHDQRHLNYGERVYLDHSSVLGPPHGTQKNQAWLPVQMETDCDLGLVEVARHEHIDVLHAIVIYPQFRGNGLASLVLDSFLNGPPILLQCAPFKVLIPYKIAGKYLEASTWNQYRDAVTEDVPEMKERLCSKYQQVGFKRCTVAGLDPETTWFTNLTQELNGFLHLLDTG